MLSGHFILEVPQMYFGLLLNACLLKLYGHLTWIPEQLSEHRPFYSNVLPRLKVLYPGKHVKMSCGILLNHIFHIIRPQSLLELFFI